ncbi:MAG: oligosaccharide flippase family protein [Rhodovibrionaceae bacterium]
MSSPSKAKIMDFAKIRRIDALWRDSFWLLVMRFFNLGIMLLLSILLSRTLGAEQYGVFAFGLAVLMIAVVPARFGFDQYLASEIPALIHKQAYAEVKGLVSWAYLVTFGISLGIAATWAAAWALVPSLLAFDLWLSTMISLCGLPFLALLHCRLGVLRGQHKTVAGQLPIVVIQPLAAILLTGAAITVNQQALDGLLSQALFAASMLVVCGLSFVFMHASLEPSYRNLARSYRAPSWAKAAAPLMMAGGFSIVIAHVGVIFLGALLDEAAAGIYQPAAQLAAFVMLAFHMVNQPLGPRIAQLFAEGKLEVLQQLITRVAVICAAFSLVVSLCFFLWGAAALSIYGAEFSAAAPALWILTAGSLATVALGPAAMILMMLGYGYLVALLTAGGAILSIVLTVTLIPLLGIEGAAFANIGALLSWNLVAAYFVIRRTGLYSSPLLRVVPAAFLRPELA